jgi:uncharacterized protein YbjQ (UPF0145 family)
MNARPYGSTLGVGELLAARRSGLRPLGLVLGTCVYHVGWQSTPWSTYSTRYSGGFVELEVQAEAWNEARRRALARLRAEARQRRALGVVDVNYRRLTYDWATHSVEAVAVGTAVTSDVFDLDPDEEELPLVNLSGEDVSKLLGAGLWPTGIVGGSTVVYVLSSYQTRRAQSWVFGSAGQNQEYEDYTSGLYEARALAMRYLRDEARETGAAGVLGVALEHDLREVENNDQINLVITVHALGTGIAEIAAREPPQLYYALNLKGRRE